MEIREFINKDLNQILTLHKEAMQQTGAYKGDGPWDNDLKNMENHYTNNQGVFLVGEIDNKIVSMGAFQKMNSHTAEIKRMRTLPEYQGKGYGKKILNELIKIAKEYNYKELLLETSDKQINARNLYIKSGFKGYKEEIIDGFNCTWFKLSLI